MQRTTYYPFGGIIADLSTGRDVQPYLYNGKELDTASGLNWYDYGARQYDPAAPHFTNPDPMQEKYYPWHSYIYCLNNPVRFVDPDGKIVETAWDVANVIMDVKSLIGNLREGQYVSAGIDGAATIIDGAAVLVPGIPGGVGASLKAARSTEKVVKATKNTYRKALQHATGKIGEGFEAHHTLPQKYRGKFEEMGINIDEPGNVVWREAKDHRKKSNALTKEWDDFMKRKSSEKEIEQFKSQIEMRLFGNKNDTPKR